jgi:hypothetical protein
MVSSICALAATVALTFDDLPLNGELPAGTTRVQLVQKVVTILDKHRHEMSHILLLHLGAFSDNILPDLLKLLGKKGLSLVTLEEAQRDLVYQLDPDAASPSRNLLEQWMDVRAIKYPSVTSKPYKELEAICQ